MFVSVLQAQLDEIYWIVMTPSIDQTTLLRSSLKPNVAFDKARQVVLGTQFGT